MPCYNASFCLPGHSLVIHGSDPLQRQWAAGAWYSPNPFDKVSNCLGPNPVISTASDSQSVAQRSPTTEQREGLVSMNKQNMVCAYNKILFSHKRKRSEICYHTDEPPNTIQSETAQMPEDKCWTIPCIEDIWSRQIHKDRRQTSDHQDVGRSWGDRK